MLFKIIKQNKKDKTAINSKAKKIQILTTKYLEYKFLFTKIQSNYSNLKIKHDQHFKNETEITEAYKKLKIESETKYRKFSKEINILYQYKRKRTIIRAFGQINENRLYNKTDPLLIMTNIMREQKEKEQIITNFEKTNCDIIGRSILAKEEAKKLRINLHATERLRLKMEEIFILW